MSPTQKTLQHLRAAGYLAEVVEKRLPRVHITRDLFGFLDVLAIREGEVLGVQATSSSNVAARLAKITHHANLSAVRKSGIKVVIHGWRKRKGRWCLREVDLS